MQDNLEQRAKRWHFGIIGGVAILLLLIVFILGDHFYTVHPAIRSLSNGVPVCGKVHQIYGGEPAQMTQLNPDEQEQFFSAVGRSDPSFSFLKYREASTVLLYQRQGGVAPLFVVLVPIDKEATPAEVKFCGLFEQTPWDFETRHIAEKAGESWRMRSMTPERKQRGV